MEAGFSASKFFDFVHNSRRMKTWNSQGGHRCRIFCIEVFRLFHDPSRRKIWKCENQRLYFHDHRFPLSLVWKKVVAQGEKKCRPQGRSGICAEKRPGFHKPSWGWKSLPRKKKNAHPQDSPQMTRNNVHDFSNHDETGNPWECTNCSLMIKNPARCSLGTGLLQYVCRYVCRYVCTLFRRLRAPLCSCSRGHPPPLFTVFWRGHLPPYFTLIWNQCAKNSAVKSEGKTLNSVDICVVFSNLANKISSPVAIDRRTSKEDKGTGAKKPKTDKKEEKVDTPASSGRQKGGAIDKSAQKKAPMDNKSSPSPINYARLKAAGITSYQVAMLQKSPDFLKSRSRCLSASHWIIYQTKKTN